MAQFNSLAEALGVKRELVEEQPQENIIKPEKEMGFSDLLIDFENTVRVHNTISGKINNLRQQIIDMRASFGPEIDEKKEGKTETSTDLTHPLVSGERKARAMAAHNNLVEDYHDQIALLTEKEEVITDLLNTILEKAKSKDEMRQLFDYIHKSEDPVLKDKLLNLETRQRVKTNLLRIKKEKDTSSVVSEVAPNTVAGNLLKNDLPKFNDKSFVENDLINNNDVTTEIKNFSDNRKPEVVNAEGGATSTEASDAINDERPMGRVNSMDGLTVQEGGNADFNYGYGTPVKLVTGNESAGVLTEKKNDENANLIQNEKLPSNELMKVANLIPNKEPVNSKVNDDPLSAEKKPELSSIKPVLMQIFSPNGEVKSIAERLKETGSVEPVFSETATAMNDLADIRRNDIEESASIRQTSPQKRIDAIKKQFAKENHEEKITNTSSVKDLIFANDNVSAPITENLDKILKPEITTEPAEETVKALLETAPEQNIASMDSSTTQIPVDSQTPVVPITNELPTEPTKAIEPLPKVSATVTTPEILTVNEPLSKVEPQPVRETTVTPTQTTAPIVTPISTVEPTENPEVISVESAALTGQQREQSKIGKMASRIARFVNKKNPTAADVAELTLPEAPNK